IDVLVKCPARCLDKDSLEKLYELSAMLQKQPNVKQVSGLFTFAPNIAKDVVIDKLSLPKDRQDPQVQLGIDAFSHDDYMRFAVLLDITFNEPDSIAL